METALLGEEGVAGNQEAKVQGINQQSEQREISKEIKVVSSEPREPRQPLLHNSTEGFNSVFLRNESSAMIKPQRSHKAADIDMMGC